MLGHQNVFKDGHALPEADVLEGTGDAQLCHMVRSGGEDGRFGVILAVAALVVLFHFPGGMALDHGLAHEFHTAVGGLVYAGDAVEGRGLARAVGADEGHDFSLWHIQRQIVHGHNAAELHGHILHAKNILFTHERQASFSAVFFLGFSRASSPPMPFQLSSFSPMMPLEKNSTMIMMTTEKTTIRKPLRSRGTLKEPM